MDAERPRGVTRFFDDIEDPRIDRTRYHKLEDILMIALVVILGEAEGWTQVELFAKSKRDWFGRFLELPNGIPSHDTFGRVFARLDPNQLGKCFARWVTRLSASLGIEAKTIVIDGKTLRASADKANGDPALHLITAWAHEAGLVLAQLAVDGKTNEITALPELVATLELKGCVVTVDALNTQTDVAEAILERGGDYVMALKANQLKLHNDAGFTLAEAEDEPERFTLDEHVADDDAHGRIEHRRYTTLKLNQHAWRIPRDRWPELKAIAASCASAPTRAPARRPSPPSTKRLIPHEIRPMAISLGHPRIPLAYVAREMDSRGGSLSVGPLYVVADDATHATAYPIAVIDGDETAAVDDYLRAIFEAELSAWTTDLSTWPARRTRTMFTQWFDVQVSDLLIDLGSDERTVDS